VIEALAAALVGFSILWLVLEPLLTGRGVVINTLPEEWEPPDPEETARGRALLALKEIEFDRATGKLSDHDFEQLRSRYEAEAIASIDGCASCGSMLRTEAKYCPQCGARR
jgi:hypothetical protein